MTVAASSVGDSLYRQHEPITDHLIQDCGHVIPLDRPDALLDLVFPFHLL